MRRRLVAVLVLLLVHGAAAQDLLVNSPLDLPDADLQDGVCDADLLTEGEQVTLRAAVQHANVTPGEDTLVLPAGLWKLTRKGAGEEAAFTGDLDVTDDLVITGAGAADCIIDGKMAKDRLFEVHAGAVLTLSGVTLRRGLATELLSGGGALYVHGMLHMDACTVEKNRSAADDGGAIEFDALHTGPSTITDVLFKSNKAYDDGGALDVDGGAVDLRGCTFAKNKAGDEGGGLEASHAAVSLINCTFSSNRATNDGGAVNVEQGGDVTLTHCTLVKNNAIEGAGLSIQDGLEGTDGTVRNCLLANAGKRNFEGTAMSGGGNVETGNSGLLLGADDQSDAQGKLLVFPLANNGGPTPTHLPKPGSVAIDRAGDVFGGLVGDDQRGLPRPVDLAGLGTTATDAGAVEVQADESP
jgi:predicted outer membrane repeat protein